jgi:hypothetical protein
MNPAFGYAKVMEALNRSQRLGRPIVEGKCTFESCDGTVRTIDVRKTHLPYPCTCLAVGGDPRRGGRAAALTPCGHMSSSWLNVLDYEQLLAPRGLEYVVGTSWEHHNHAWGRACDGTPGVAASGVEREQLRDAWWALGQCFPRTIEPDGGVTLAPTTRFEGVRRGMWLADARTGNSGWVARHGALAVACAWDTFSVRGISRAGFVRHLRPLGMRFQDSRATGAFPAGLELRQWFALSRAAWMGAFDAFFEERE